MSWHDYIFSDQGKYRFRRHVFCWLLWWVYVVFTIFYTKKMASGFFHHQPGLNELGYLRYGLLVIVKSLLLLLTHLFFCYVIIYFLLPSCLLKKRNWHLASGLLILCALMVPVGYFLYSLVYPVIDKSFGFHITKSGTIVWASVDAALVNAIKVSLIAVAIMVLKQWWARNKEKEQLEKERINAEVELLKAQIHPAFLFSTLDNITSEVRLASPKAPEMLIKLSDLLSYMLYECEDPKVRLEREINMLREYIALEKIKLGERLELTFRVNGNLDGMWISPLLLLPFVESVFSYCNQGIDKQVWVNLDITVENNQLTMKIISGFPVVIKGCKGFQDDSMVNIKKRLDLLYPGGYELKVNAEQELLLIQLSLKLDESAEIVYSQVKPILSYA
jgi:sensor histidine kinase YesM